MSDNGAMDYGDLLDTYTPEDALGDGLYLDMKDIAVFGEQSAKIAADIYPTDGSQPVEKVLITAELWNILLEHLEEVGEKDVVVESSNPKVLLSRSGITTIPFAERNKIGGLLITFSTLDVRQNDYNSTWCEMHIFGAKKHTIRIHRLFTAYDVAQGKVCVVYSEFY